MRHRSKLFLLALICAVLTFLCCYEVQAEAVTDSSLLRFHVIANSDSPFDQQVKLRLRDEIIDTVNAITNDAQSATAATAAVTEHLNELQTEANNLLKTYGVSYEAEVSVGKSIFPTKSYENITLPAGKYIALKIVLGEGKGKNWWCVLYPSLCFVKVNERTSVAYREQTEQNKQQEQQNQTQIIPVQGTPQQTVIRSRLWELLCK